MNYLVKRGSGSSDFEIHNNSPQTTYDEHTVNWWKFRFKTDSNEIVYEKNRRCNEKYQLGKSFFRAMRVCSGVL